MQWRKLLSLPAAIALLGFALRPDSPLTLDAVLSRWEQASRECRSLDVELTRFRYGRFEEVFGRPVEIRTGRLYVEMPDRGRWEIKSEFVIVWNQGSVLQVVSPLGQHRNLCPPAGVASIQAARDQAGQASEGAPTFWKKLSSAFLFAVPLRPAEAIPFVLLDDRSALESQFDVSLGRLPDGPLLTMKPRTGRWKYVCDKIEVILDPTTYRTIAVQETRDGERVVYVLERPHINVRPKDRDRLLDLSAKNLP